MSPNRFIESEIKIQIATQYKEPPRFQNSNVRRATMTLEEPGSSNRCWPLTSGSYTSKRFFE